MVRFTDYTLGTPDSQEGAGNLRNFLQDEQDDFRNDGGDGLNNGGGNSGGGGNTGGGGTKTTITENDILLNITCNINGAGVKFNGSFIGSVPKQLRISKVDLVEKGDRIIEIGKDGYTSKEKYVVSLNTNGVNIQKGPEFESGYGNLSATEIVVKYYVDNSEQPFPNLLKGQTQTLVFTLKSNGNGDGNSFTKKTLTISLFGIETGNPILLRKNGLSSTDMFPQLGIAEYTDKSNTKYTISSSDLSLYRITKITYNDELSKQIPLVAKDNESLTMTFKLKTNYSISIEVEAVPAVEPLIKPVIELLNDASRLYNINTEIGVPLAFKKNSSVKAITIIVGDDVLEFDDLEVGDVAGVTIPHSSFEKIGKYNIKIFPFSLNDYGNDEVVTPIIETPIKPIKPIFDIIEETPIKPDTSNSGQSNNNIQQQPASYVNYAPNMGTNIPPPNTTNVVQGGGGSDSYDS